MFRLNKSSSGVSKNHKTNYNMSVHIWDPNLKLQVDYLQGSYQDARSTEHKMYI